MNILIYMSGGFDTYGPSRHLYKALIEDILSQKHTVHLIESHSTGVDPDVPDCFLSYKNFSYETIASKPVNKKAFVKRYLTAAKYCINSIKPFRRCKGYDVVMVQSTFCAPFAVYFAKKFLMIPVVWNIQDMFPGAAIANGVMKKKWMQLFFYRFHKIAYRYADHISVISEDMKKKVMDQGVPAEKITVVPDWYDDSRIKVIPWDKNLFVKKYNMKKDSFYVQYAGTMGFNFDYRMVINVAKKLRGQKDIIFQMIGNGSQKDDFIAAASHEKLDNIVFLPLEPEDMVPHVYSACSICLIPLPRGVIGNSVPSKAGLLMACHKVIVNSVDEDSDYSQMFDREKIGISASNNDPDAVAAAILKMREDNKLRETYATNAQNFSSVFYSRKNNTCKHIKLLEQMAKANKRGS